MSRVCLVGAGYISRVHSDAIGSLPGLQVTAVVDPNESAARSLAGPIPNMTALAGPAIEISREMLARFDTSDVKQDLGWSPAADPARFIERAIRVHAS